MRAQLNFKYCFLLYVLFGCAPVFAEVTLTVPPGFKIEQIATVPKARSMVWGEQETLFQTSEQNEAEKEIFRGHLLESLAEEYREVLVLTKIIGFSVAEAAGKLGISESLVKVRVHRAIRKLKRMMETDKL